jgi:hypothetical protein
LLSAYQGFERRVATFYDLEGIPTLRIWGESFEDNVLTLKSSDGHGDLLRLYFDQGEKLSIWCPTGLSVDPATFRIADATRVRLEWFYDWLPSRRATAIDPYFEEYLKSPEGIHVTTNIDWYKPKFKPKLSETAVEIL